MLRIRLEIGICRLYANSVLRQIVSLDLEVPFPHCKQTLSLRDRHLALFHFASRSQYVFVPVQGKVSSAIVATLGHLTSSSSPRRASAA